MAKKKVLIVGASGYGNVGDDSYRCMFQRHFAARYDLEFHNSDLPQQFPACDAVVLGGGGLLYAFHDHFKKMVWYLKHARKREIPYAMVSVGYQFKPLGSGQWIKKPVEKWGKYVRDAQLVTVRSKSDLQFTRHLGKEEHAFYYPDLCYGIAELVRGDLDKDPERQICVIPGAGLFHSMDKVSPAVWVQQNYTLALQRLLEQLGYKGMQLVRMGAGSADNAKIRLVRKMFGDEEMPTYGSGDPRECLKKIASAEVVISGRFHGMVFARSAGVPVITMPAAPYKIWTEDVNLDVGAYKGHIEKMGEFLKKV